MQSKHPNIVFIVADDLGYGDLPCYWETPIKAPVLESVAKKGLLFNDFNVCPLCSPTRSAIMTGLYSAETGMFSTCDPGSYQKYLQGSEEKYPWIKPGITMLPQLLKEAGYKTGIFGKWHLGYANPNLPDGRGFDEFVGFLAGHNPYRPDPRSKILHNDQPYEEPYEHTTDLFTDHAVKFIESNKDQPFFLYVPYNAVHGPLYGPRVQEFSSLPQWREMYADFSEDKQDYYATITHMDYSIGRIINALEECGVAENTFFIFMSDNGASLTTGETAGIFPGCNGPFRAGKGSTYNGGITVPMMMMWPGVIPEDTVSDQLTMHVDLFSTILDAAGITPPAHNSGRKLRGMSLISHICSGGQQPLPERLHYWEMHGRFAARKGEWKIVSTIGDRHNGDYAKSIEQLKSGNYELYRLTDDISERNDLRLEYPEIHRELGQALIVFFESL